MATRAKFNCQTITQYTGGSREVTLSAVTSAGSAENESFWNATPSGQVKLTISNPKAQEFFEVGKSYYLDFTEAA